MATDFFGYNRKIGSSNELASSEYATLSVNGKVNLCQSVDVQYQQDTKPIYEVGNPSVYFVTGHAQGSIRFGRIAGSGSFWANLKNSNCGQISKVSINSDGGGCYGAGGKLNFDGAIIRSVSLTINTGAIEIAEQADLIVASMS